ncbi:DUF2779 domain-containing protein [Candidatus Woesearchaeota archaeon]|jgi:hypothetical protein|nr:DUF2779 domain-containing protein [Candidatus Woesearchaeota archaeon]MBT4150355.1 DUF2779 domain-containing protein [Candidatus Woesearchaeota archaeon]MBT4434018.1 DUF2779 domain-containing protein [Candidatus Woesearchaeota archaeon]MBT7332216.1 DUF2779 domain-containing protein [Candidatus Woesearchaeota archaeon]
MLLSKSKYLLGLQCPKQFWTKIHEPDQFPETSIAKQEIFDQGHEVGQFAKKMFPEGIDIPEDDFIGGLKRSKEVLKLGKPCFEVALCADVLYSRADILIPNNGGWDIIEVKSGCSVKDINVEDVAFQKYVYEKCGIVIKNCYLMFVNNKFVKNGDIDVNEFFTKEDITERVEELIGTVPAKVKGMLDLMNTKTCPDTKIGLQCSKPYDCDLAESCWKFLPEGNIFELYYVSKKKAFGLLDEGVMKISELPSSFKVSEKQKIQLKEEIHLDKEAIKGFLDSLKEPYYYMDFESYQTAIPSFEGGWPYQQIVFQYSVHVNGDHHEFLGRELDCQQELYLELKKVLGDSGSIIVFSKSFEIGRLRELGKMFDDMDWVESAISRIVDLRDVFSNFYYYNPKQKGSAGLKSILPAVTGKDYSELDIRDGKTAGVQFKKNPMNEKVRADLLKYCGLDTEGMVWIVKELKGIV